MQTQFGLIGIYDNDTNRLLERWPSQLRRAIDAWERYDYRVRTGPAFPNLFTFTPIVEQRASNDNRTTG